MNGMKALKGTAVVLSLAALTACGQGFTPTPATHTATPTGGGSIFGGGSDTTTYQTASYSELVNVITVVMGVSDVTTPATIAAACDATAVSTAACPVWQPLTFLAANQGGLGVPVFSQSTPLSASPSTNFTSGGFKAWVVASSSAAGLMMMQPTPALFPKGVSDYTYLYETLLGRAPTQAEIAANNALELSIKNAPSNASNTTTIEQREGAAVASMVLGSLEFLMVN